MTKPKKVVLITGAADGIGLQLATQLAAKNNNLLSTDYIVTATASRLTEELEQLASSSDGVCRVKRMDVTDETQCEEVVRSVIETDGRIDVLGIGISFLVSLKWQPFFIKFDIFRLGAWCMVMKGKERPYLFFFNYVQGVLYTRWRPPQ